MFTAVKINFFVQDFCFIDFIKAIRRATGAGLKDAKDTADALRNMQRAQNFKHISVIFNKEQWHNAKDIFASTWTSLPGLGFTFHIYMEDVEAYVQTQLEKSVYQFDPANPFNNPCYLMALWPSATSQSVPTVSAEIIRDAILENRAAIEKLQLEISERTSQISALTSQLNDLGFAIFEGQTEVSAEDFDLDSWIPKPGDKVEFVMPVKLQSFSKGSIYKVADADSETISVERDDENDENGWCKKYFRPAK